MTQQLSSLSSWLPISFYSYCVTTTREEGCEENGPQSRLYLDFSSLAMRVGTGINSKALGLITPCSLVEEPDVGTSVSSDITHLGGPLDPSVESPARKGGLEEDSRLAGMR